MKFLETCILALMLITQQILADGPGASDADATGSLGQYEDNSGSGIIAQEIKRARIPQFVGKRDFYANDDLDLSADTPDIPLDVAQAYERNLLSSLLAGSSEGLPEEGATQSDYFGRQTRYIPMMVGRRGKWAPKFIGKRRGPLFVGRRRSPYFVGKRTSQTDNELTAEKRRNPLFVGKRSDSMVATRGFSKPMLVGRRGHPIFIGRRMASGDLDSSIFMGKRSVENLKSGQDLSNREKRSIDTQHNFDTKIIYKKTKRKKRDNYTKLDRRKRDSYPIVRNDRRNFDAPYFVGKRRSDHVDKISQMVSPLFNEFATNKAQSPVIFAKRNREFDIPDFVGKRSQDQIKIMKEKSNYQDYIGKRYGPPDFIGKRYSPPDFIGKRYSPPDFIGKRYSPPEFIGKRYSPPDFIGKRYGPPDFIGKRYSPPDFIGKRYSPPDFIGKRYSPPDFIGKRFSSPISIGKRYNLDAKDSSILISSEKRSGTVISKRYSPPNFIGKRGYPGARGVRGFISPDFIGKRDNFLINNPFRSKGNGRIHNSVGKDRTEPFTTFANKAIAQLDRNLIMSLIQDNNADLSKTKTQNKTPIQLDNTGYPEVTEFLPALNDEDTETGAKATPLHVKIPGIIRKRSSEVVREQSQISFTAPDFIGKRAFNGPADLAFVSDGSVENVPGHGMYQTLPGNSVSKYLSYNPSLDYFSFFPNRKATSFTPLSYIRKPFMQPGYVQEDTFDRHASSTMEFPPSKTLRHIMLQPKLDMVAENSMISNEDAKSEDRNGLRVSFVSDFAGKTSVGFYGKVPETP